MRRIARVIARALADLGQDVERRSAPPAARRGGCAWRREGGAELRRPLAGLVRDRDLAERAVLDQLAVEDADDRRPVVVLVRRNDAVDGIVRRRVRR